MSDLLTEMTRMDAEAKSLFVVGIDPSLSNTAVVCGNGIHHIIECFKSQATSSDVQSRIGRFLVSATEIDRHVANRWLEFGSDSCAIYIEGYSFASHDAHAKSIGEHGGILREYLCHGGRKSVYEVVPTTLKKFATGKGNAKKDEVRLGVFKHWGFEATTNDECDAFALYQFGLCCEGLAEPKNKIQRDVIEKFMKTRA